MNRLLPRWAMIVALFGFNCAEEVPGVAPPEDQLHFPQGMVLVPGPTSAEDVLVVSNSNFDQRFNAGSLMTLSVDGLFSLAPDASETEPQFIESFGDAVFKSMVKVHSFGGDIVFVPTGTEPGQGSVFVPTRGSNRLTFVSLSAGNLTCTKASTPEAHDCSDAHIIKTHFEDPFSIAASATSVGQSGLLAVGHLGATLDGDLTIGNIGLVDVASFESRVTAAETGTALADLPDPLHSEWFANMGGTSGVVYVPSNNGHGSFLATAAQEAPDLRLSQLKIVESGSGFTLSEERAINLDGQTEASAVRSLTLNGDNTRAYISIRFDSIGRTYNAAIATVAVSDDGLRLASVFEMGEELGKPFLLPAGTGGVQSDLLYIPDIRMDRIFILDVSTDLPILVGTINGLTMRTFEEEQVQVRLLDAPAFIVFVKRNNRTLGVVSNFANSTLALIDVTDADPRNHRLIARIGRDIDPEGQSEGP